MIYSNKFERIGCVACLGCDARPHNGGATCMTEPKFERFQYQHQGPNDEKFYGRNLESNLL